jgi:cell wall-associated NlpC family hydrolase
MGESLMKFNRTALSAAAAGAVLTVAFSVTVFAAVKGVVTSDGVNVRAQASMEADKIGTLSDGDTVEIEVCDGKWYKINYGGSDAYVYSDYVKAETETTGNVVCNKVNVRAKASTDSDVVGQVNNGDTVTIMGEDSNWFEIKRTNGDIAYVSKGYISGKAPEKMEKVKPTSTNTASVNQEKTTDISSRESEAAKDEYAQVDAANGLKVRDGAGTNFQKIGVLNCGEYVDVLSKSNGWLYIKADDGTEGFVSSDYATVYDGDKPKNEDKNTKTKGEEIVAFAEKYIGTPYVWGGTNLSTGVDCSGFVYCVYKNFGITLNRSSSAMALQGTTVSKSNLIPGDLVFFDTDGSNDGSISHVGIYVGSGQYIHSSSGKTYGVTITSLSDSYSSSTYVTAKRMLK